MYAWPYGQMWLSFSQDFFMKTSFWNSLCVQALMRVDWRHTYPIGTQRLKLLTSNAYGCKAAVCKVNSTSISFIDKPITFLPFYIMYISALYPCIIFPLHKQYMVPYSYVRDSWSRAVVACKLQQEWIIVYQLLKVLIRVEPHKGIWPRQSKHNMCQACLSGSLQKPQQKQCWYLVSFDCSQRTHGSLKWPMTSLPGNRPWVSTCDSMFDSGSHRIGNNGGLRASSSSSAKPSLPANGWK